MRPFLILALLLACNYDTKAQVYPCSNPYNSVGDVRLKTDNLSNFEYNVNTVLFSDDFGVSNLNIEKGRKTSKYVPSSGFQFAEPIHEGNPYSGECGFGDEHDPKLEKARIFDGYYAIVAPGYIKAGWWQQDCWFQGDNPVEQDSWYWWSPAYNETGAVRDRSGTVNGAVMVINAGGTARAFYERIATVQVGAKYKASMWIYLEEVPRIGDRVAQSAEVQIDIKDPVTKTILYSTNIHQIPPSRENLWTEVSIEFAIPVVSGLTTCDTKEVLISFKNLNTTVQGNDYYVDDISVRKVRHADTCPPPNNCVADKRKDHVNLNTVVSYIPRGYQVKWFTKKNGGPLQPVEAPEKIKESGEYYPFYYHTSQSCYANPYTAKKVNVQIYSICPCTEAPSNQIGGEPTKLGITNLSKRENWPEQIPNGFIALESKSQGFVISRLHNETAIDTPVKGMLIYDKSEKCVKLYNGSSWKCIKKACNNE